MRRKAALAALRADLESNRRDMWQLAEEVHIQKAETVRLQAIVDKQDLTILALWSLIDQQTDKVPTDCEACYDMSHEDCGTYKGQVGR